MVFSKNDIYPNSASQVMTTQEQTLPEGEERNYYSEGETETVPTIVNDSGMKSVVNKKMIFGSLALLGGLLVALHFID